jgi:biotin carboxylase
MKKELVVFLGSLRTGEYEAIARAGYAIGLILDSGRGALAPEAKERLSWFATLDFKEGPQAILEILKSLQEEYRVLALLNTREGYVRDHAWLCAQLGLPALPVEAVDRVTNKTLMREAFVRELGPASTARFEDVQGEAELSAFAAEVGYPLILKPNHLAASLFVTRVDRQEDLLPAYRQCILKTREYDLKHGIATCTEALVQVEEFLEGSLHSIDAWVGADGIAHATPAVDVVTGKDLGWNDFHHFSRTTPSALGGDRESQARTLALGGIRALGLKNCIAHVELIWTPRGPRLLEIAARAGAHRNRLLERNHGIELNRLALEASLGKLVSFAPRKAGFYAIVTPFPRRKQAFGGISGIERIFELPSYVGHEIKAVPGQEVGPAGEGFYSVFQIELEGKGEAGLKSDIQFIRGMERLYG